MWVVQMQPLSIAPHQGGTHLTRLRTGAAAGSTAGRELSKANTLSKVLLTVSNWESDKKDVS